MYNRANNSKERTKLTDDYLSQCINELQNMITACQSTINGKNFSQSCRDVNLDPGKTESFLTGRLMNLSKIQTPVDETNSYDGYKHFYMRIFGEARTELMTLPSDYKESVDYVLNNTGLSETDSYLVQKRFGIGEFDYPTPVKDMADTTAERTRINADMNHIFSLCREKERTDILKQGLEGLKEEKRKQDKKIERKISIATGRIVPEDKRDISKTDPETLRGYLKSIPIQQLNLIQPSIDSLEAAGMHNVYDVLSMTDDAINNLSVRHEIQRSEIRTSREMYAVNNFGVNVSHMMDVLSEDSFTKGVESISKIDVTIEQ